MKNIHNLKKYREHKDVACLNSYFISFEGIEGAGKTSHMAKLKNDLEAKGFKVLLIREPGGTPFGEKLREAILSSSEKLEAIAEAYLFASSRAQLLKEVILPHLSKDRHIIICDRYIDSSIAYQGVGRNLGIENILSIHNHFPLTVLPDMTLYIKISVTTSMNRQQNRGGKKDYFESETIDFYNRLVKGYDMAEKFFPDRISIIDGENDMESVYQDIKNKVFEMVNSTYEK